MPPSSSIGSSSALCRRLGMSVARCENHHAAASRTPDARTAPTMLFVTASGPIWNSLSASIAT